MIIIIKTVTSESTSAKSLVICVWSHVNHVISSLFEKITFRQKLKIRFRYVFFLSRRLSLSTLVIIFHQWCAQIHCRQVAAGCWLHHVHVRRIIHSLQRVLPKIIHDFPTCTTCGPFLMIINQPKSERATSHNSSTAILNIAYCTWTVRHVMHMVSQVRTDSDPRKIKKDGKIRHFYSVARRSGLGVSKVAEHTRVGIRVCYTRVRQWPRSAFSSGSNNESRIRPRLASADEPREMIK